VISNNKERKGFLCAISEPPGHHWSRHRVSPTPHVAASSVTSASSRGEMSTVLWSIDFLQNSIASHADQWLLPLVTRQIREGPQRLQPPSAIAEISVARIVTTIPSISGDVRLRYNVERVR